MTTHKLRVFVVDDSVLIRRMLTEILQSDSTLEVVGTAVHGRMALARLPSAKPDIVILDIEMPEMDGLATLPELRKAYPRLPVIMFSTMTERGARATLEALYRGANDYVTKPTQTKSTAETVQRIREQLIPKIKALCARRIARASASTPPSAAGPRSAAAAAPHVSSLPGLLKLLPKSATNPIELVAIGCSTGGPMALEKVLAALPADFSLPIVITQHMPPLFTQFLAERLESRTRLKVSEGKAGTALEGGHAYVAPGDFHMVVGGRLHPVLGLNQDSPENSCRPAVDVMFRSIAETFKGNVLAVVLTGMGQDGLKGCERIAAHGGHILAQDEDTSVVWGMPGAVVRAELATEVLPLDAIGPEILSCVKRYGRPRPAASK